MSFYRVDSTTSEVQGTYATDLNKVIMNNLGMDDKLTAGTKGNTKPTREQRQNLYNYKRSRNKF